MKHRLIFLILLPFGVAGQPVEYSVTQLIWRIDVNAHNPIRNWQGSTRSYRELDSLIAAGVDVAENTRERGVASLKHGDYDQAVQYYERACALDPKHHGYVGWVYLEYMRDYERALAHLNAYDSLTTNPNDMTGDNPVRFLKGRAYSQMGQYSEAIGLYSSAIETIEMSVGNEWVDYLFYIARGVAYQKANQFARALADFDSAVKNSPQSAIAHYHRGRALHQLGRMTEARTAYTNAQFFMKAKPVERDPYFEHFDAVYEPEIEAVLSQLTPIKP